MNAGWPRWDVDDLATWLRERGYTVDVVDGTHINATTKDNKPVTYTWHPTLISGYWRRDRGKAKR